MCLFGSSLVAATVSPDMPKSGRVRVIVQYRQPPAATHQRTLLGLGGILEGVLSSLNALITTIDASLVNTLAADPNVT
jgi:hypothetical protein